MKKTWTYYKIKWTSFFLTFLALFLGFIIVYIVQKPNKTDHNSSDPESEFLLKYNPDGHYTNEEFSALIDLNLTDLDFLTGIVFTGKTEGEFTIEGTLDKPERLIAACKELESFDSLIIALKDESISINGHIGENEMGNGCFVADTITIQGQKHPASIATSYIEQYTCLNDLLEVPIDQIGLAENGITFYDDLPPVIQTVFGNQRASF